MFNYQEHLCLVLRSETSHLWDVFDSEQNKVFDLGDGSELTPKQSKCKTAQEKHVIWIWR